MDRRITVTAKAIIALELFFMDFVLSNIIAISDEKSKAKKE